MIYCNNMSTTNPTAEPYNFRDGLAERDPVLYNVLQAIEHPDSGQTKVVGQAAQKLWRTQQDIIEQLYRARTAHHLTQAQLAQKVGMTQTGVARFESGKGNPTLATLLKLAQALGLTLTVKPTSVKLEKT